GTGKTHRFLHQKLNVALTQQGVAVECMTTVAACRTYNILMSEGRKVAAALLL
ncbi:MAG: Mth938-like domain-containing protein, partial [Methylotenera sp.]